MLKLLWTHRTPVICSIVASLLCVFFLEPLLSYLGRVFLITTSFLSKNYTDRIYTEAALLETYDFAYGLTLFYIILPVTLLSVALILAGIRWIVDRSAVSASEIAENDTGEGQVEGADEGDVEVTHPLRHKRLMGVGLCLIGLLLVGAMGVIIGASQVQLEVISSFKQHLRILRPYIDQDTEDRIVSDWSRMSSRDDYVAIQRQLQEVAEKNKLQLPDNYVY